MTTISLSHCVFRRVFSSLTASDTAGTRPRQYGLGSSQRSIHVWCSALWLFPLGVTAPAVVSVNPPPVFSSRQNTGAATCSRHRSGSSATHAVNSSSARRLAERARRSRRRRRRRRAAVQSERPTRRESSQSTPRASRGMLLC